MTQPLEPREPLEPLPLSHRQGGTCRGQRHTSGILWCSPAGAWNQAAEVLLFHHQIWKNQSRFPTTKTNKASPSEELEVMASSDQFSQLTQLKHCSTSFATSLCPDRLVSTLSLGRIHILRLFITCSWLNKLHWEDWLVELVDKILAWLCLGPAPWASPTWVCASVVSAASCEQTTLSPKVSICLSLHQAKCVCGSPRSGVFEALKTKK